MASMFECRFWLAFSVLEITNYLMGGVEMRKNMSLSWLLCMAVLAGSASSSASEQYMTGVSGVEDEAIQKLLDYYSATSSLIPGGDLGSADTDGHWGDWGEISNCPNGQHVYGYRIRTEERQGSGDDTALNAVELYCKASSDSSRSRSISSAKSTWGSWSGKEFCSQSSGPVTGFRIRIEKKQGDGDDTAANDVDLYCDGGQRLSADNNTSWGSWSNDHRCPDGYAVSGIMTRVESPGGDDTALNGVRLFCTSY